MLIQGGKYGTLDQQEKATGNPSYGTIGYNPSLGSTAPSTVTPTSASVMPAANATTLYSGNVDDKYIPDQNDRLTKLSQVGPYTDAATGTGYYANGDLMDPNDVNVTDEEMAANPSYKMLADMRKRADSTTDSYIASLQRQAADQITAQRGQNATTQNATQNALLRYGASRSGSGMKAMGAVGTAGLQAINTIQDNENVAIAKAKQAQQDGDFQLAEQQIGIAEGLRKDKQTAAQKTYDQTIQSSRDNAIAGLVDQGVTDPTDLLNKLNYDDNGNQTGDYTLDEVNTALNTIRKPIMDAQSSAYDLAIKNNAPASVIQAISSAKTPAEVAEAMSGYGTDPLDQEYKRAQIAKIYSDLDAASAGEDPAELMAYAQQYAATGKIPTGMPKGTFGTIAAAAKELPKQGGELVDVKTGVQPDADATTEQAYSALYSAIQLSGQLKELDQERFHGLIAGSIGKVTGSETQQRYVDLRDQITDLLARARSGAAINADEEARYAAMLPGRFSQPLDIGASSQVRIDNFTNALTSDLDNKASARGWAVNGLSKVSVDGTDYTVGSIIQNDDGEQGRVNADGTITVLNQ